MSLALLHFPGVGLEDQTAEDPRADGLLEVSLDVVVARLRRATSEVACASPYISADVAGLLATAVPAAIHQRRLLTALDPTAISHGSLDLEGLWAFRGAGFDRRSVANLHAKVVVVDRTWALVTSGNLTRAGTAGGNVELGVVLEGAAAGDVAERFEAWWGWHGARRITTAHLRGCARYAPTRPVAIGPHPEAIGGRRVMPRSRELARLDVARRDPQSGIEELRRGCGDPARLRPSPRRALPAARSRAYRLTRALSERHGRPRGGRAEVRTTLRLVLRGHRAVDARAHAAFRLGNDSEALAAPERERSRRALARAAQSDPARAVRLAAGRALRALGAPRPGEA